MKNVLLFFVDGVGLGVDDAAVNPFVRARLPTLSGLLGGRAPIVNAAPRHALRASLIPVDAVLGFDGTPQSGTGQASLLTGHNAVALHGRHFGPWVPSRLRPLVREQNVLTHALHAGCSAAFANAYPEEVKRLIDGTPTMLPSGASPTARAAAHGRRVRRGPMFLRAGPPLAAIGAGLLTRHTPELERGEAVASELTNEGWREHLGRSNVPAIDAQTAGRNLARIALQHDVTLFAHYATDDAGHQQDMDTAVRALELLDSFVEGLVDQSRDELLVIIIGDHGNIEDVRTGHTRNPALGIVIGRDHERIAARIRSLTDVKPLILEMLTAHRVG